MEHYVTLFDIGFVPQGLALHRSLQRHGGEHLLWVLCMDKAVQELLEGLALPDVRTIALSEIETDALLKVKPGRTRAEYCWTLTPFTHDAVLDRDRSAHRVTYVDADVWLVADPTPVLRSFEVHGAAVQITEHAYAPDHDQTALSGRFCVQFLTMDRERSASVRRWWQERCVDWCFARFEDGRFGDQKYLDTWPERFGGLVHVAEPKGWFQGPWNATRFPYSEAVIYHFHSLRIAEGGLVRPAGGRYGIPRPHLENVYLPYLQDLADAVNLITEATGRPPTAQIGARDLRRGRQLRRTVPRILHTVRAALARSDGLLRLP